MATLNPTTRRILTIDDNEAIHADFRKILAPAGEPSKLSAAKAALFGSIAASEPAARFEVEAALQGEEGLKRVQEALIAGPQLFDGIC